MEDKRAIKEIYSERVNAGKRTYFFDVKSTQSEDDYYLAITESKKRFNDDGGYYEKHKIFLYKEDLNKFVAALERVAKHIKEELLPDYDFDKFSQKDLKEEEVNDAGDTAAVSKGGA